MKFFYFVVLFFLINYCFSISNIKNNKYKSAFDIVPDLKAVVFPSKKKTFNSTCFTSNTVYFEKFDETGCELIFEVEQAVSKTCFDVYLITTGKSFKFNYFFIKGKHKMTISWTKEEMKIVKDVGLMIFRVNSNLIEDIKDGFELYEAFYKANPATIKKILEERLGRPIRTRETGFVRMNWDNIQSGDYAPIFKLNPTEGYIIAGIDGQSGHASIFMRDPDNKKNLYVVEAQPEKGVFMTDINIWFETMKNGTYDDCFPNNCSAVILPLSEESRKYFDERKAWNYVQSILGKPYIQNGEFFSAIDTSDPSGFKPPMNPSFLFVAALLMERFSQTKPSLKLLLIDGINIRLGTKFEGMDDVLKYCDDNNINIFDVFSMPEKDSYTYSVPGYDKPIQALMCSSTIARIYKASGLYDGYLNKIKGLRRFGTSENLINAQEFTPRDLYQMKIFNTSENIFPECRGHDDLKYCQFLGQLIMDLEGANSVDIYPHMNEKCSSYTHFPPKC